MGAVDAKPFVDPVSKCCSDCSRYCLDECECEYACGCCKFAIKTHHTPSADEHASKTPADEDFISVNESELEKTPCFRIVLWYKKFFKTMFRTKLGGHDFRQ